jgi:nitrate/nitrite transport system permease protein
MKSSGIPLALVTWQQALVVFSDPFYSKGPNDQGVGWNVLASLKRVAHGLRSGGAGGHPGWASIGRFSS